MINRCPMCGAENSVQARFCRFCGVRLEKELDTVGAALGTDSNQYPAEEVSEEKELWKGKKASNQGGNQTGKTVVEKVSDTEFPTDEVWTSDNEEAQGYNAVHRKQSALKLVLLGIAVIIAIVAIIVLVNSFSGRHQTGDPSTDDTQNETLDEAEIYYVTNVATSLNVYNEADEASTVLGELYNGNSVKIQTKEGDYWRIYSEDLKTVGYVDKNHLTADRSGVVYRATEANDDRIIGYGDAPQNYEFVKYVYVNSGSLVLRSAASTLDSTSIGELYNYYPVYVVDSGNVGEYWYVYSPDLKMYGYVNSSYLIGSNKPPEEKKEEKKEKKEADESDIYYTSVKKGYLALRTAQAFDASNEIGKLNNGDKVEVQERSGTYWYVYAPTLGKYGYVNSNYLTR